MNNLKLKSKCDPRGVGAIEANKVAASVKIGTPA